MTGTKTRAVPRSGSLRMRPIGRAAISSAPPRYVALRRGISPRERYLASARMRAIFANSDGWNANAHAEPAPGAPRVGCRDEQEEEGYERAVEHECGGGQSAVVQHHEEPRDDEAGQGPDRLAHHVCPAYILAHLVRPAVYEGEAERDQGAGAGGEAPARVSERRKVRHIYAFCRAIGPSGSGIMPSGPAGSAPGAGWPMGSHARRRRLARAPSRSFSQRSPPRNARHCIHPAAAGVGVGVALGGSSFSVMPKWAANTLFAAGAAKKPPDSLPSIITARAISGSSAGA